MSRTVRVAGSLHEEGDDENIGLHRFALFTACSTAFPIFVGGLITSNQAGLSVPDWPTSCGWNTSPRWKRGSPRMFGLLWVHLILGAFTIWTEKAPLIATAHVAVGALILGTSF